MKSILFHIAGLPIEVRAAAPGAIDDLPLIYLDFPAQAHPMLTISVARVPGFHRDRSPEYPAFSRQVLPDSRLFVQRFDAEGEIDTGSLPLMASFRVGPSANSLEACIRIAASLALPRIGAFLLHSSAIACQGSALVFSGHSGAGKSTISAMLPAACPACSKIADELVVPPYFGPNGVPHGAALPLSAIHFLVQAPFHKRSPLPHRRARSRSCR